MKKSILLIAGLFIFLMSLPVFAQADPGDDPAPAAPIDDYVFLLAFIALVFVFFKLKAYTKVTNIESLDNK